MKLILPALLVTLTAAAAAATETTVAWKTAEPADTAARGEWWASFEDPVVDELIKDALGVNGSPDIVGCVGYV